MRAFILSVVQYVWSEIYIYSNLCDSHFKHSGAALFICLSALL